MPDSLIVARIAKHWNACWREAGKAKFADNSRATTGRPRKTPSWTAITAMRRAGSSSPMSGCAPWARTASRNRPPAFRTARSSAPSGFIRDGKFGTKDGKANFMATKWRGLEAPGKQAEKDKLPFLINNGRTNMSGRSVYLDQHNDFVMDRLPLSVHPDEPGGHGRTQAASPAIWSRSITTTARRRRWSSRRRRRSRSRPSCCSPTPTACRATWSSQGCERTDHPELQADLGQHPQASGRSRRRASSELQVIRLRGRIASRVIRSHNRARVRPAQAGLFFACPGAITSTARLPTCYAGA